MEMFDDIQSGTLMGFPFTGTYLMILAMAMGIGMAIKESHRPDRNERDTPGVFDLPIMLGLVWVIVAVVIMTYGLFWSLVALVSMLALSVPLLGVIGNLRNRHVR